MVLQIQVIKCYANLKRRLKVSIAIYSSYLKKRKERPIKLGKYDDAINKAQEIIKSGDQKAIEQLKKVIEEYKNR